jgi:GT2 family glycosyltransferase
MNCDVDVSVVIVSWNTRDLLRDCLSSIYRFAGALRLEVIVVDNGSVDGSAEMVRQEFPSTVCIANSVNAGFAAASNQGLRRSRGRYYLLLNPDTLILPEALQKTVSYADTHPDVAVAGCQVLECDQRIQRTGFSFPTPWNLLLIHSGLSRAFPKSRFFGRPELGWWDRTTEREVEVVSGMFMLVRRSAAEHVGLMDGDYFVYAEEADWCFRFWKAGWRCVFAPVGQIIHLDGGGKSTSQVSVRMFVQLQKSLMLFQSKNLGRRAFYAAKLIYVASNSARVVAWGALSVFRNDRELRQRATAALAALRFHLLGIEPS